MGLFDHQHNWSNWERSFHDCEYVRHCEDPSCQSKEYKMNHNWGEWKYETSKSCHFIRECYRCGEIDSGRYQHEWSAWHYESETRRSNPNRSRKIGLNYKGTEKLIKILIRNGTILDVTFGEKNPKYIKAKLKETKKNCRFC